MAVSLIRSIAFISDAAVDFSSCADFSGRDFSWHVSPLLRVLRSLEKFKQMAKRSNYVFRPKISVNWLFSSVLQNKTLKRM